ncbi:hypothetical protein AVEN_190072-1 [Araneus ventricosus]|uniref:Uncharacterized protein n=1 Tax=Araneus ventricosus TaxID=182803 RepID=A0A4Y2JTX9_ARAVE|nr:hypothetical protein AVEN_190072-1 [Araneus ventricosus]
MWKALPHLCGCRSGIVLHEPKFPGVHTETASLHTRRTFCGIGFGTWNSPVSKLRPCHQTTETHKALVLAANDSETRENGSSKFQ